MHERWENGATLSLGFRRESTSTVLGNAGKESEVEYDREIDLEFPIHPLRPITEGDTCDHS